MNNGGDLVAQENRTMGKKISTIGQPLVGGGGGGVIVCVYTNTMFSLPPRGTLKH